MKKLDKDLKLIYVYKNGENSKGEGIYEFIFSKDPTKIDIAGWGWDLEPACDNAEPPDKDHIDLILNLKTDKFKLFCLHEAVDREYMHGYHLIHALAYEEETELGDDLNISYDSGWDLGDGGMDELPLLVFHYGTTLKNIEDSFYERDIILNNNEFVESKNIEI